MRPAAEVIITLGRDGRVYFHDLSPELLPVAQALAPDDLELAKRTMAAESLKELPHESTGHQG